MQVERGRYDHVDVCVGGIQLKGSTDSTRGLEIEGDGVGVEDGLGRDTQPIHEGRVACVDAADGLADRSR